MRPDALEEVVRIAQHDVDDVRGITAWATGRGIRVEIDVRTCTAFTRAAQALDLRVEQPCMHPTMSAVISHNATSSDATIRLMHICIGGTCRVSADEMTPDELAKHYPAQEKTP